MDIFLTIVGFLFMLLGIIGSFLPVLPGPPTSWIGLLILHLSSAVPINWTFLIITLIVAIFIYLIDYIIPAMGTKKFGGSRAGMFGTIVGLLVAIFFPILGFIGIIFWPFVGAFIGELANRSNSKNAAKAAFGSLIGFLTGTFLKFLVSTIYLGLFIMKVWDYKSAIFSF